MAKKSRIRFDNWEIKFLSELPYDTQQEPYTIDWYTNLLELCIEKYHQYEQMRIACSFYEEDQASVYRSISNRYNKLSRYIRYRISIKAWEQWI